MKQTGKEDKMISYRKRKRPNPYQHQRELDLLEERIKNDSGHSSIYLASGSSTVLRAIEKSPFPAEATKRSSVFACNLLEICLSEGVSPGPEQFVACVAFYAFAHTNYREAIPYLISYVSQHSRELPGGWSANFATHALKVLTQQNGANEPRMHYSTAERCEALDIARRRQDKEK